MAATTGRLQIPRSDYPSKRDVGDELRSVFDAVEESRRILEWPSNWDGEGSPSFAEETWDRAAKFVRDNAVRLWEDKGQIMEAPEIQPGEKGRIVIEWSLSNRELLVAIPANMNEQAEYYGYDRGRTITIKGNLDTASPQSTWLLQWTAE